MGLPIQFLLVTLAVIGIERSLLALGDGASDQLPEYSNSASKSYVTTSFGAPIDSLTSVLTAGPRGPVVLQDVKFLEIMAHFNRERIPERVVHAKGAGAFGYFEVTKCLSEFTKACIFNDKGKKTRVAVRFSTVGTSSGSADTIRDPRGFAIKFYSECGNHDLVGNNTPVFFVRDTMLFFNFIHSQKPNPVTHVKDFNAFWDFLTLRPESMYQVLFMFSDRGIPDGFQHMDGFGSNTYKLVNASGQAVYCKFHFRTDQGLKYLTRQEAQVVAGVDPDYGIRKLYNAIHDGECPSWTFYVQIMTFEQAEKSSFNPFDVTKIWPEDEYPLIEAGKLVLTENPKNYFSDVESFAVDPGNMIEGIEASPDKNLQGRLFAYTDAQRYRLGGNFMQLPINSPIFNITNYQRDGVLGYYNQGGAPNYYPNSFYGPEVVPSAKMSIFPVSGDVERYETGEDDNFSQPRVFYEQLSADEKERLIDNLVDSIKNAASFIQDRAVQNFLQVSDDLGQRVSTGLAAAQ